MVKKYLRLSRAVIWNINKQKGRTMKGPAFLFIWLS